MNWNSPLFQNIVKAGTCVLLCAAILLGLFLPAANMTQRQPENPLEDESIREITILKVGETAEELNSIVVPNEGSAEATQPKETEPNNSEPQETKPEESTPEESMSMETDPTNPDLGSEGEGNEDGDQGEEGGNELDLDLAAVMTWYQYGTDPKTITCAPSSAATKTLNTAQLNNNTLKYEFELYGDDARYVQITAVSLSEGDAAGKTVAQKGTVQIQLPEGNGARNYTFFVDAVAKKTDDKGKEITQNLTFIFVLKCTLAPDLDLKLTWYPNKGNDRTVLCSPDRTEVFSVKNHDLIERVFRYSVQLTGALADSAKIISAEYTTASGQKKGELTYDSGTLILDPAPGSDQETYLLTFTVQAGDQIILYNYRLAYQETLDVQLSFNWMDSGTFQRTLNCQPGSNANLRIKNNQLSAGALPYAMELTGGDAVDGRILSVSYGSEAGDSGNLEAAGSLPLGMPNGASSNTYRIVVNAMVKGQRLNFEIRIHYTADVSLQMQYIVLENGQEVTREITCENARAKTAEAIYDDQLTDGLLRYTMQLTGSEGNTLSISSVTCYRSGNSRTVTLTPDGEIELLLREGKTGENSFEITAQDDAGNSYHFTINIPYKHRGENNIKILSNLTDGQEIINETKTNLSVRAWSEDQNGTVISYIPANGTDTKLIVQFDGETLNYVSSSGASSEYDLYPVNPEVGDTNTHTLYIYAEDAFGNYGELTLTLKGIRREAGQEAGKATIYVDMTVLGLGVTANLSYDVLANEPISYVIAKAIMGKDTGEPFGSAEETLGWSGYHAGTLDTGFYLQSLTTGHTANALEGSTWPGATEEEVLRAIDEHFGAGTGLATLWRCLYRNGLNKSRGSGNSFGEFDYTSGSGWMYSVGGATYYPGQSMSSVYLQDGDVLILRYTLAYGWDVGGGSPGYGSTVGYCVSAVNGSFRISHRMETITNPDGSVTHACRCCGIEEDCLHQNVVFLDQEDGYHIRYCNDCKKTVGDSEEHIWVYSAEMLEEHHRCSECGAAELHQWKEVEGSNTATCTEPGTRSVQCVTCHQIREEQTGPKGHTLDNQWQYTKDAHYEKCSTCGLEVNRGSHQYYYISGNGWEDFECEICHALHSDDGDNCDGTPYEKYATCTQIVYGCDSCNCELIREGHFEEYHSYDQGVCIYCEVRDPEEDEEEPSESTEPAD